MYHNNEIQVRKLKKVILSNSLHGFYIVLFLSEFCFSGWGEIFLFLCLFVDWEY